MVKCSLRDNINFWRSYEKTKNKEIIDFSKKPEIKQKFDNLIKTMKKRLLD